MPVSFGHNIDRGDINLYNLHASTIRNPLRPFKSHAYFGGHFVHVSDKVYSLLYLIRRTEFILTLYTKTLEEVRC